MVQKQELQMPSPKDLLDYHLMSRWLEENALKGVVARNMDKNFVQRIVSANPKVSNSIPYTPVHSKPGIMYKGTHLMASGDGHVFPMIEYKNGKLAQRPWGKPPLESINMGSDAAAQWFGENYKRTNPAGFYSKW